MNAFVDIQGGSKLVVPAGTVVKEFEAPPPPPATEYLDNFDEVSTVPLSSHAPDIDSEASAYTLATAASGELDVIGGGGYAQVPVGDGSTYGNHKAISAKLIGDGHKFSGEFLVPSGGTTGTRRAQWGLIDGSFNGFLATFEHDPTPGNMELKIEQLTGGAPSLIDSLVIAETSFDSVLAAFIEFDASTVTFDVDLIGTVSGAHSQAAVTVNTFRIAGIINSAELATAIRFETAGPWPS